MFQWIEVNTNNSFITDNPSKLKIRDVESYKLVKKQINNLVMRVLFDLKNKYNLDLVLDKCNDIINIGGVLCNHKMVEYTCICRKNINIIVAITTPDYIQILYKDEYFIYPYEIDLSDKIERLKKWIVNNYNSSEFLPNVECGICYTNDNPYNLCHRCEGIICTKCSQKITKCPFCRVKM